jgi:hypothetical protein
MAEGDVSDSQRKPVQFERIEPILRVNDMTVAVRYYVDVLGFENAPWGTSDFTCVSRDGHGIYLTTDQQQGAGRAWVWVGVEDADRLHKESKRGARPSASRRQIDRGRWRCRSKIQMATCCASGRTRSRVAPECL